jgi:hypothetical protein
MFAPYPRNGRGLEFGLDDGRVEVDADEGVLADAGRVHLHVLPDRRHVLVADVDQVVGPQV